MADNTLNFDLDAPAVPTLTPVCRRKRGCRRRKSPPLPLPRRHR